MFDDPNNPEIYQSVNSVDMEDLVGFGSYDPRPYHLHGNRDDLYYHRLLFLDHFEKFSIVHETEKAMLFEHKHGKFWVPKKLIRIRKYGKNETYFVHKSFRRKYLETNG